jgi:predicted membrane protein
MVLQDICPPALIYLVFSTTQVVIDTVKGTYNVALVKLWVTLIFTILLNFLCNKGLGIVSWIIVFIPFILMTVIVTLILVMFGLDPITGRKRRVISHHKHHKQDKHHHKEPESSESKHNHSKKGNALDHPHKFNSGYDESKISDDQKKVLNDDVKRRTELSKDPLQK